MEIPNQQENGYTIYTKSECGWCRRVKEMVPEATIINCDSYLNTNKEEFLAEMSRAIGKEYRTFPMVFYDGVFIGGYEDTKKFIDFDITKDF
jgi:glutaredoxin